MDYFDSKVYKMKNYIDEINQEIFDLKRVRPLSLKSNIIN